MDNLIIIAVILIIVGAASWYIYKAKKSGKKCIGCPDSGCCSASKNGNGCGCGCGCSGCSDKTKQ